MVLRDSIHARLYSMCTMWKSRIVFAITLQRIPGIYSQMHFHATWTKCVVLSNNYSCAKPSAPLRKVILPAEGQGQRDRQREEIGGKRQRSRRRYSERKKGKKGKKRARDGPVGVEKTRNFKKQGQSSTNKL